MSKQLHILSVIPDDVRFRWETLVQLNNFRKYGYSDKVKIIVFLPADKLLVGYHPQWKEIEKQFPETKFFYYKDTDRTITSLIVEYQYIPILRLCCLEKFFKQYPEIGEGAVLYIDSDVIFTKQPNIEQYIDDDINYLSDTHTYLNADYIDSKGQLDDKGKPKYVREDKYEEYKCKDILGEITKFASIDRRTCEANNDNTGGAQYLLKNISSKFFSDCIDTCLLVRMYLQHINQQYFRGDTPREREDNGVQSWCADMWAIQWNLWRHKLPSQTPKWMDFSWATDKIEDRKDCFLMHNAGITESGKIRETKALRSIKNENDAPSFIEAPAFFKGSYTRISPFNNIPELEEIINHPISSKYCISLYVQEILDTYNSLIKNKKENYVPAS